jgi:hypothetical protein
MPDRILTPEETDDAARDAVALLRACNAGDQAAMRAILDNASLATVARMLAPRAIGFMEMKARAGGFTGDESKLREFVDVQLRKSTGILLAMAPGNPGWPGDGEPPRQRQPARRGLGGAQQAAAAHPGGQAAGPGVARRPLPALLPAGRQLRAVSRAHRAAVPVSLGVRDCHAGSAPSDTGRAAAGHDRDCGRHGRGRAARGHLACRDPAAQPGDGREGGSQDHRATTVIGQGAGRSEASRRAGGRYRRRFRRRRRPARAGAPAAAGRAG